MNKSEINLQIKHYIKNIREIYSETYLAISPSSISFYSLFWQRSTNLEFYYHENKKPLNIIGCIYYPRIDNIIACTANCISTLNIKTKETICNCCIIKNITQIERINDNLFATKHTDNLKRITTWRFPSCERIGILGTSNHIHMLCYIPIHLKHMYVPNFLFYPLSKDESVEPITAIIGKNMSSYRRPIIYASNKLIFAQNSQEGSECALNFLNVHRQPVTRGYRFNYSKRLKCITLPYKIHSICGIRENERQIVIGGEKGILDIWDIGKNSEIPKSVLKENIRVNGGNIRQLLFIIDGLLLLLLDYKVMIVDLNGNSVWECTLPECSNIIKLIVL